MSPTQELPVSSNRRLYRALYYVCDKWLPCDQALLQHINQSLNGPKGTFICPERILGLIQSDVSLHLFTLARLYALLAHEGVAIDENLSAREFILEGGVDFLRLIFEDQKVLNTSHSLEDADDIQKLRLFESITSASASQVLAPSYGIDADDGYSGALVRQAGFLLIAWNYPTVYAQALRAESEGQSADAVFIEKLGFSAEVLTIELLHRWGVSRTSSRLMYGLKGASGLGAESTNPLTQLYRTGELLARANLPELYPSAKENWEESQKEIVKRLGSSGMEAIRSACEDQLNHYRMNIPELFSHGLTLDPKLRIPLFERSQLSLSNPYLSLCEVELRDAFTKIYAALRPQGDQEEALREILREVIPKAGFKSGCVFTVDPSRLELIPQAFIGAAKRVDFKNHDLTLSNGSNSIVALAYLSPQPIVEYHRMSDGSYINRIASYIGLDNRVGVLFLEIDGECYDLDSRLVLNQFRAIQHALSACLT
jgi:hypothetical protein